MQVKPRKEAIGCGVPKSWRTESLLMRGLYHGEDPTLVMDILLIIVDKLKNGVPHGYGGVYEIDKSGWHNDRLLYSGEWVNGVYQDPVSPLDRLTDEEWRHIN